MRTKVIVLIIIALFLSLQAETFALTIEEA